LSPTIPFDFDPPASDYETAHLIFQDVDGGQMVSWPLAGVSLFVPASEYSPSLDSMEAQNGGKFKAHRLSGFSIGNYHEFLVSVPTDILGRVGSLGGFRMGSVEATFGFATPLAAMIFSGYHHSKYFGEWSETVSLRIVGVGIDEVEAAFIFACNAYKQKFGATPVLFELDDSFLYSNDDEESEKQPTEDVLMISPLVINVEPLRFLYNGLLQHDDAAACIYYYKVLEYFSFFTNATEIKKLRHDGTISDADFSQRVLELISRDEKGHIFKLIASVADTGVIKKAMSEGLVANTVPNLLSENLYAFRNSVVHGKFSYGYVPQSTSVLDEDPLLPKWRALLLELARRAINQYGTKKT
jgi:hypothetical protein